MTLQCPDGEALQFGSGDAPHAGLRLNSWAVFGAVLRSGDVGFGEAYVDGQWSSPDLAWLLRLVLANREAPEGGVGERFAGGLEFLVSATLLDSAGAGRLSFPEFGAQDLDGSWAGRLLYRIKHLLNRNSRHGSRRNIQAHYDLGNSFYRLWLDETMNYSSAWFAGNRAQPLAHAQVAKMQRAIDECQLQPGQRLLEIGCGWGAVAELATRDHGLHVTGVTLSDEQFAHATDRLSKQGLAGRAGLRLQDYRDVPGAGLVRIVSIEMFEAVGRAYWGSYFRCVHDKLKPGGRACIQSITIRDDLFERYVRGTDFIQQYIFPGGLLPSPSGFRAAPAQAGLEVVAELDFGADYAETLRRWRQDFLVP